MYTMYVLETPGTGTISITFLAMTLRKVNKIQHYSVKIFNLGSIEVLTSRKTTSEIK